MARDALYTHTGRIDFGRSITTNILNVIDITQHRQFPLEIRKIVDKVPANGKELKTFEDEDKVMDSNNSKIEIVLFGGRQDYKVRQRIKFPPASTILSVPEDAQDNGKWTINKGSEGVSELIFYDQDNRQKILIIIVKPLTFFDKNSNVLTSLSLKVNDVTPVIAPLGVKDEHIEWTSSNPAAFIIGGDGPLVYIGAVAVGSGTLTADGLYNTQLVMTVTVSA